MHEATARRIDDEAAAWPLPAGVRLAPIDVALAEPVEHLLDLAFGYDRHQRTAYRLREQVGMVAAASFVAIDADGRLVGSIQAWPLSLTTDDGATTPLRLLGPIAVHPQARSIGIGRAMLSRSLAAIDDACDPALLIGDPGYYGPFGFSAARTAGWTTPGPVERHRLLLRAPDGVSLPVRGLLGPGDER